MTRTCNSRLRGTMRPSLGLLLLLFGGLGLSAHGSEIINGKRVPNKEMLYMASVQNAQGKHICGGFLIGRDRVLTAAHCGDKNLTSVVLGTHNLKRVVNKTMRYAVTGCKHQSYNKLINGNDIMLLKLYKKVPLKNKRIKPIQLPSSAMRIKDNDACWVAGWGSTKQNGASDTELQKVDVRYMNLDTCKRRWQQQAKRNLPDTVMCAGGFTKDGKGFCKGDSGGPLVCNHKAVGIVSFNYGERCDYPNLPNVYTDLSKHLRWIKENSKKKKC